LTGIIINPRNRNLSVCNSWFFILNREKRRKLIIRFNYIFYLLFFIFYLVYRLISEAQRGALAYHILKARGAKNRLAEKRVDLDNDVDDEARKNGSGRIASHITALISLGLLGFAFTSSSTLRLRRQRDSLTLKAVSHPRRGHTHTYVLSCNCTLHATRTKLSCSCMMCGFSRDIFAEKVFRLFHRN